MPADPLADLAGAALALLCLLCAIAIDLIIRVISAALGKFGVGPFSINLGSIVYNFAAGAVDRMVDDTKGYFVWISDWVQAHAYLIRNLFFQTGAAISQVWRQIDHLIDVTIPDTVSRAGAAARSYGDSLKNEVETDMKAAEAVAAAALTRVDRDLLNTIHTDVSDVKSTLTKAIHNGVNTAETFATDADNVVTGAYETADKAVAETAADATNALKTLLGGQISTLTQTVADNLVAAEKYAAAQASGAVSTAENFATSAANTAATTAEGVAASALAGVASTVTSLTSTVSSDFSTAESDIKTTATTLGTDITNTAGAAADALTGAFGGLYTDLTGQSMAANGDLSSIESLIAGAILGAVSSVAARVAKLEECSVGVCDDSPNNFSNLLNDAMGVAEFAGVFAFLSSAISSPASAEQSFAGLIGGLYADGDSLFDSLLSL